MYYDYKEKRARADIEEGYEAAKYYIRRYDNKNEYMIRLPPIDDCKRSYLGEVMPYPDMSEAVYKGIKIVNLRECNYYIVENFNTRVHIYMDYEDGYIQNCIRISSNYRSMNFVWPDLNPKITCIHVYRNTGNFFII